MNNLSKLWWDAVRGGFYLLYNQMAFTYDFVSKFVSLGQWRCWQRSAIDHLLAPEQGMILEIAHGTGDMQIDLQNAGYRTIGYDLSPNMGRITQQKLVQEGKTHDLTRGVAQQLPFPDNTFAGLVCTFPTDFIINPDTLREIYRVLQPDAPAAIVLNGVLTGGGVVKGVLEWLYEITGQRDNSERDGTHFFTGYGFTLVKAHKHLCENSEAHVMVLIK